jgi:limonene-1,2-epoxide hydrolase
MSERLIRDFCDAWSRRNVDELLGYFAVDAVYHNIPIDPAQGRDAIRNVMMLFVPMSKEITFEIKHLAEEGNIVLTERVDRFVMDGGTIELPVMGVFEVQGGKIKAWRDYFDMQMWLSQMPGASQS